MKKILNRHFLKRTFGRKWHIYFPIYVFTSLVIALSPIIILFDFLEFNKAKFCEEWLKGILSLSAIFLIFNYFNYHINYNRSKDKLSMLISIYCNIGDTIFTEIEKSFFNRDSVINQVYFIEKLMDRIISEDEFLYNSEGFTELFGYSQFYSNLRNHIGTSYLDRSRIDELKSEYNQQKVLLNNSL